MKDSSHTVSDTGNWTMENSRPKLNIYLQKNKLPLNFDYTSNGPDHLRTYTASMTITIKHLGKVITGSGSGPTKKQANRMCSLSLVGQLYRLGEIEAYFSELTDTTKKEEQNAGPFDFRVSDSILSSLRNITTLFEFCPQENNKPSESTLFESPRQFKVGQNDCGTDSVITWRSPSVSWNPWTNCEISINSNKNTTNKQLFTEQQRKLKFEPALQQRILERQSLPISRSAVRILDAIDCNPVVIICGMTGCGKTTQVPQFVVDDMIGRERGSDCAVIVTQPQRICTISIAERVAYERCEVLGESVGYCVKFEKLLPRPHASILFCTSDVLLRRMESGLRGVSHVIIDEIHERDLKTDVLLLILRDMIRTYPTLKVVLMSATADNDDISSYFGKCPIINITEKCYSVTEYFLEDCVTLIEPQANVNADSPLYEASSKEFILIENLLCYVVNLNVSGNILIFLPDWNAISTLYHLLKDHKLFVGTNKFLLLPLHSQISREAQRDIFNVNKAEITKVILSTDIAESSITIRDVVFVIDSAKTTIKRYCARDNSCSFETIWASKSALKQRRGRAGRTRPGYCFHLCTTDQYTKLPQYLVPEILRSPLHEVILILKLLSLGNPATILKRALQPPSLEAIEVAISFLIGIGAITRMIEFTDVGLILSKLPIEPRLGRMIILSCIFKCANAACIIAVADSLPEPFVIRSIVDGPTYLHKQFSSKRYSDHIAVLGAFQAWQRARNAGIDSEENFCKNHGLSVSALRLIYEAKMSILSLLQICALLCIGFYPNVCVYNKNNKLRMNNEQFAQIHTSSINYNCKSFPYPFFTYSEKIHAEVIYLKHLTVISPLHLLLFGCQRITWKDDLVLLDDWIALRMPREVACMIISIRQILEMLAIRTASSPMVANRLEDNYERAVQLTQQLFTESFELHSNLRSIRY
ncbi:uncharacterized protein TRIADDRAFT_20896 [Trichoplax adhaerens]|uniref:RNA helicase n=1 Tax=Trichoplax adhaerens TaxID=10228 RepID=B3RNC4_TRIAD|nr:hypothetical protein TRIADDRAFT_20896 [Trichoplax adhaerens]EDV27428.1 hypothetical protein TRIADDRAFT_20896 [Trichoplax adhaerens]|eukprot:XP_002109262.1 hypothetical protein TRIADDRAFT_20896 [Trichoplax adhaerens]